jgi:hypothetical protein
VKIDFAYVNYEHGGSTDGSAGSLGRSYQFDGLVRLLGDQDRWPDIAVMGEAEGYEFGGGAGLYGAASALSEASGRGYTPLLGTLPREWGPIGPALFVDTAKVRIHNFFSGREPDFYARNRNLLVASLAGRADHFRVVAYHGDYNDSVMQVHDVRPYRRYANPSIPTALIGDFNAPLSGPWVDDDFSQCEHYWQIGGHLTWEHGRAQGDGSRVLDTQARDYLCGWWDPDKGERVGGVGFRDVAELAGVHTPTVFPSATKRPPTAIDGAMVNAPWAEALVLDSVHVHEPADPAKPDSDHKRISFTVDV